MNREEAQNGYFTGGEICGVQFYPLTLDRLAILQGHLEAEMDNLIATRLAMAVYALTDDEAAQPDWTLEMLMDQARGFGSMPIAGVREFEAIFEGDTHAIRASESATTEELLPDE